MFRLIITWWDTPRTIEMLTRSQLRARLKSLLDSTQSDEILTFAIESE